MSLFATADAFCVTNGLQFPNQPSSGGSWWTRRVTAQKTALFFTLLKDICLLLLLLASLTIQNRYRQPLCWSAIEHNSTNIIQYSLSARLGLAKSNAVGLERSAGSSLGVGPAANWPDAAVLSGQRHSPAGFRQSG